MAVRLPFGEAGFGGLNNRKGLGRTRYASKQIEADLRGAGLHRASAIEVSEAVIARIGCLKKRPPSGQI